MNNNHSLGLIPEIADYLHRSSAVTSGDLADGAAIAVMSSFAAGRYCTQPSWEDEPSVVTQSVLLIGEAGTGKGVVMEGVERLFRAVGDMAYYVGFASKEDLWNCADEQPGFLWLMRHDNHHDLAAWDPGYEEKPLHPTQSRTLFELQMSTTGVDVATCPFRRRSAKIKPYIRPAPVTLLAETTPLDLKKKLPRWMASSPFYGQLLMVLAMRETKERHRDPCLEPPSTLVAKMRELSALRASREAIMVQMDKAAEEAYRVILDYCALDVSEDEPDAVTLLAHRTLNVAALFAIGIDHRQPRVTRELIIQALGLTRFSREGARAGLEGITKLSELGAALIADAH